VLPIRPADQAVKIAFPQALEAALALGERERAEQLLATIEALPPGRLAPSMRAHAARFRARLAAADGEKRKAERAFATATSICREYSMPFYLAVTLTEQAEWLVADNRGADAEPLLSEAREIFERLGATPWLGRVESAESVARAQVSA
jgi:ATP/maltotriose-dependent transcriptional regulator MalT